MGAVIGSHVPSKNQYKCSRVWTTCASQLMEAHTPTRMHFWPWLIAMSLIRRATRLCSSSFQAWHDALSKFFLRLGLVFANTHTHSYLSASRVRMASALFASVGIGFFVGQKGWVPKRLQRCSHGRKLRDCCFILGWNWLPEQV